MLAHSPMPVTWDEVGMLPWPVQDQRGSPNSPLLWRVQDTAGLCSPPVKLCGPRHPLGVAGQDPSPSECHPQPVPFPSSPLAAWEAELLGRKTHSS